MAEETHNITLEGINQRKSPVTNVEMYRLVLHFMAKNKNQFKIVKVKTGDDGGFRKVIRYKYEHVNVALGKFYYFLNGKLVDYNRWKVSPLAQVDCLGTTQMLDVTRKKHTWMAMHYVYSKLKRSG